jgi:hypothetical protein
MDAQDAADLARELERAIRALSAGRDCAEGVDRAVSAFSLVDRHAYSPLRTLLEHGLAAAVGVQRSLREHAAGGRPPAGGA